MKNLQFILSVNISQQNHSIIFVKIMRKRKNKANKNLGNNTELLNGMHAADDEPTGEISRLSVIKNSLGFKVDITKE